MLNVGAAEAAAHLERVRLLAECGATRVRPLRAVLAQMEAMADVEAEPVAGVAVVVLHGGGGHHRRGRGKEAGHGVGSHVRGAAW